MTWTYSEEYYKNYTRDTWNESAESYGNVRAQLDQWTPHLLDGAKPQKGNRVLDVATGPGEPALTMSPLVGPTGRVLGVDLSERMIDLARDAAKRRGVENVDFRVMDAEGLDVPTASMDLWVSRFGLQIFTDPDRALAEALRILRPGGRIAATVWGPGERCPALHAIVGPMLEHAEPDETGYLPTPYEMGGDGELVAILEKLGFQDVAESRFTHQWRFKDEEDYLQSVLRGTPLGHSLGEEEPEVQRAVLEKTRKNLLHHKTPQGISLDAEAVVVSGRKP